MRDCYETQMGLHLVSNGGDSTASEWGLIFGAYGAWVVPTGVANLWSWPELERKGFVVEAHTHHAPAVTSPGGLRIEFQHDTGRCEGFPFLYLDDPAVVHFSANYVRNTLPVAPRRNQYRSGTLHAPIMVVLLFANITDSLLPVILRLTQRN